jgi:uncharacterized protein (TIGR02117 family)
VSGALLTRRKAAQLWNFACAALILAHLGSACAAPRIERHGPTDSADTRHVFVVHNNWHAAIVVNTAIVGADEIPELIHFTGAKYVEISWGDADFFPAAEAGIGLALKAAFWSRGSVLHLVGFSGTVQETYPGAELIGISLSTEEFHKLISFISAEFRRHQSGRAATPSPGLFPQSHFFPATSKFSLLRTCNAWVAEAFLAAGLPLRPGVVFTAGTLADQLRHVAAVK